MSYLTEFAGRRREAAPGAEVWRGTIAKTATTVTEKLPVTIPAFSPDLQFPPCRWQPRVEPHDYDVAEGGEGGHVITACRIVYPQRGDACLVAFDENDEPWILVYGGGA